MSSKPIRVGIIEDAEGYRQEVCAVLAGAPGIEVAGAWDTAEAALQGLPSPPPEIMLVDIRLPGMSGIGCIRQLRIVAPGIQSMVLTAFDDHDLIFQALVAGARGYLLKHTATERLLQQVRELHEGGSPISPTVARRLVEAFEATQGLGEAPPLSPREWEILHLLARGRRYKEIATACHLSPDTIRSHVQRIYRKLQVNSRAEAIARLNGWRHTAPWLVGIEPDGASGPSTV